MSVPVKVGVHYSCFFGLVGPVEGLEYVSADELVVAVDVEDDRVVGAVVEGGEVEVGEGGEPQQVFDVGVALLVDGVEGEVVAVERVAAVGGGVVDDDHPVVGVVLREDGVEVVLNAEVGVVVKDGRQNAHRQLFLYLRQLELALQPQPLPPVLLNAILQLLLAADQVVLGEEETRVAGLRVDEADPLLHELDSLRPGLLVLVQNILDSS